LLNVTTTLPQTIGVALGGAVVTVGGGNFALFPDRHRLCRHRRLADLTRTTTRRN
jgi:hypothetical protein